MFGLGAWEIGVILLVALIFIGPKKLPEIAAQLGRGMRDLQRAANDFKREITYPTQQPPYDPSRDPYRELAQKQRPPASHDDPSLSEHDGEDVDHGGYPDLVEKAPEPPVEQRNAAPAPAEQPAAGDADKPPIPTVRPAEGAVGHGVAEVDDPPESNTTKG